MRLLISELLQATGLGWRARFGDRRNLPTAILGQRRSFWLNKVLCDPYSLFPSTRVSHAVCVREVSTLGLTLAIGVCAALHGHQELAYSLKGLIHYHQGREHGSRWEGMVLEE